MNFFGRRKGQPMGSSKTGGGGGSAKPNLDSSGPQTEVAKLRTTMDRLEKRKEFLNTKVKKELKLAMEKKKQGNKAGALSHLKRKKMYEKEVAKLDASIMNLEQQALTLESSSTTIDIVKAQEGAKNAMKNISRQVNPDKIADLQDDINEQMETMNEVSEILAQDMTGADEDELEDQLNALMMEDEEELEMSEDEQVGAESELNLPSVPVGDVKTSAGGHKKAVAVSEDDEDAMALAALEAEMAM